MITYFIIFLYNVHEDLKNLQLDKTKVTECSAQSEVGQRPASQVI